MFNEMYSAWSVLVVTTYDLYSTIRTNEILRSFCAHTSTWNTAHKRPHFCEFCAHYDKLDSLASRYSVFQYPLDREVFMDKRLINETEKIVPKSFSPSFVSPRPIRNLNNMDSAKFWILDNCNSMLSRIFVWGGLNRWFFEYTKR